MSRHAATPVHVRWEPGRLYWAVVHAPGWRHAGQLPPGLHAELADEVPLPGDDLHAVCAPVGDGRVVVCAAARAALEGLPAEAATLTPASLPACLGVSGAAVRPESLNLLVGPCEPASARRARRWLHLLAAASVAMGAVLLAVGFQRRAANWERVAERAAAVRSALIVEAGSAGDGPHALIAELARLRRRVEGVAAVRPPPDAVAALAGVLESWPAGVASRPQALSISPSGATISVNVDGDPAPFLAAFTPPEGWLAAEPRLNVSGGVTRLTLHLAPESGQGRAR